MTVHVATNLTKAPILITYPRSGLHFFSTAFEDFTGIHLNSSHEKVYNNKNIITIIRNPLDSISSWYSMNKSSKNGNLITDEDYVSIYNNLYLFFNHRADTIIKFEDMSDNIEKVMEIICNKYNLEKIRNLDLNLILSNLSKNLKGDVIHTSKNLENYNNDKEYWKTIDLSESIKLYNILKQKSITL